MLRRIVSCCFLIGLVLIVAGCDTEAFSATSTASTGVQTPSPTSSDSPSLGARATQKAQADGQSGTSAAPNGTLAWVDRVVDGDTIMVELNGQVERLRYIGVDAPESVRQNYPVECFGPEASDANKRLVDGREVMLVKDVSDRDQYGRLLRYVYVQNDSTGEWVFVNLLLVEEGYANSVTFPPDVAHLAEFRAAERQAREEGRGLWGACSVR